MTKEQEAWANSHIGKVMKNQMSGRSGECVGRSPGSRGNGMWFTCRDEKGEFSVYRTIPKKLKSTR